MDDPAGDLSALANVGGGVLIIGIGTDKADRAASLHEQDLHMVEQQAVQAARDGIDEPLCIEPVIVPSGADPARGFLVVAVPPSDRAPHITVKKGRVLHRVGTHNKLPAGVSSHCRQPSLRPAGEGPMRVPMGRLALKKPPCSWKSWICLEARSGYLLPSGLLSYGLPAKGWEGGVAMKRYCRGHGPFSHDDVRHRGWPGLETALGIRYISAVMVRSRQPREAGRGRLSSPRMWGAGC